MQLFDFVDFKKQIPERNTFSNVLSLCNALHREVLMLDVVHQQGSHLLLVVALL